MISLNLIFETVSRQLKFSIFWQFDENLVIGKSNKTRCFKGITSIPCWYCAQKKSWMDSELSEEWVREQDRTFALEGRKVALVIDNLLTTHPNIENIKSIKLYFLPPNTTSCLQPMDQGVIWSLKCKYALA